MTWNYEEALDYLYSFINYEVHRQMRYAPDVISLERPRKLLAGLGDPHRQYPVIHITGTKGKGSVGAICHAALQSAGLRTGLYSSPHLQDFRERFRIDAQMADKEVLAELLAEIKPVADQLPDLTWFELTTALAFLYFARQEVGAVVCEVGLGGRLDATNLVHPVVSVITSLSFDHTHLLGNTLEQIATEKAGIIKPGVSVVSAPQPPEAEAVLTRIASERGAPLTLIGRDWLYETGSATHKGQHFWAAPAGEPLKAYWTPLIGQHQVINSTVALAALELARERGLNLPPGTGESGLRQVNWPARFEIIEERPWIVLDVAHNGASARCLADTLVELFPKRSNTTIVFGAMVDKDVPGMFEALLPLADHLILTQAVHPRAFSPEELATLARATSYSGTLDETPVVADALRRARQWAGTDGLILIAGSLVVGGEARDICGLKPGQAVYRIPGKVEQLSAS